VCDSPSVSPSATPTPCVLDFRFPENEEAWTFTNDRPPFNQVEGEYNPARTGSLDIITLTNENSFAFWESPLIGTGADSGLQVCAGTGGPLGPNTLYRATWTVFSDQSDSSVMPVFRVRSSSQDFQRSDVLVSTPVSDASFSPWTTPRDYTHYFMQPAGQDKFRLDIDVLSFEPTEASNVRTSLDRVTVDAIAPIDEEVGTNLRTYDFLNDRTANWTVRPDQPIIQLPGVFNDENGLLIRGVSPPQLLRDDKNVPIEILFGYWGSDTNITFESDKLYRLRWSVSSDATALNRAALPTFRFRTNDSSLMLSTLVNIDSANGNSRVPFDGAVESYDMWLVAPAEVVGNTMILSFDYLYVNKAPTGSLDIDDPMLGITLTALEITSFPISAAQTVTK